MSIKKEIVELIVSIPHFNEYGYKNYGGAEGDLVGRIMGSFGVIETGYIQRLTNSQALDLASKAIRLGQGETLIDIWKELCNYYPDDIEHYSDHLKAALHPYFVNEPAKTEEELDPLTQEQGRLFLERIEQMYPNVRSSHPDADKLLEKLVQNYLNIIPKKPKATVIGDPEDPNVQKLAELFDTTITPINNEEEVSFSLFKEMMEKNDPASVIDDTITRSVVVNNVRHFMHFEYSSKSVEIYYIDNARTYPVYKGQVSDEVSAHFVFERYKLGIKYGRPRQELNNAIAELYSL